MWGLVRLSHYATYLSEADSVLQNKTLIKMKKEIKWKEYILQTVARFKGNIQLKKKKTIY